MQASNLLMGRGPGGQHQVYLVDFGLCSKYIVSGLHKPYVHDRRWAHEGTQEYTSREAHIGCAGRRGDIEVLLYNIMEWIGGWLPWDRDHTTIFEAQYAKFHAFNDIKGFMNVVFKNKEQPEFIEQFMKYVKTLNFEAVPDYNFLRRLLEDVSNYSFNTVGFFFNSEKQAPGKIYFITPSSSSQPNYY